MSHYSVRFAPATAASWLKTASLCARSAGVTFATALSATSVLSAALKSRTCGAGLCASVWCCIARCWNDSGESADLILFGTTVGERDERATLFVGFEAEVGAVKLLEP